MSNKIYLYPIWIRIWHWVNAFFFLFLIISGLSMQYANPQYPWIPFEIAVSWHNIAGIIITVNYLFFVIGNSIMPNGKFYRIQYKGYVTKLRKQIMYYMFGIFKKEAAPFPVNEKRKFNPLQKLTYVIAMYVLMPLLIITGLALLYPETIVNKVFGISGILLTAMLHAFIGFCLSIFMLIHVYFCTICKSGWTENFKSMFNGWH